jgi:hypothetical protein
MNLIVIGQKAVFVMKTKLKQDPVEPEKIAT